MGELRGRSNAAKRAIFSVGCWEAVEGTNKCYCLSLLATRGAKAGRQATSTTRCLYLRAARVEREPIELRAIMGESICGSLHHSLVIHCGRQEIVLLPNQNLLVLRVQHTNKDCSGLELHRARSMVSESTWGLRCHLAGSVVRLLWLQSLGTTAQVLNSWGVAEN